MKETSHPLFQGPVSSPSLPGKEKIPSSSSNKTLSIKS
jgi:hypothetical protein